MKVSSSRKRQPPLPVPIMNANSTLDSTVGDIDVYVERNVYDLSKQQILDRAHLNSSDDIVCLVGSRAAGLQHGHSDYDAIVITSGPIPESRRSGTKFYYGVEPNVLSLDIMYLSLNSVKKWLTFLEPDNRRDLLRMSRFDLMHIWRITKAELIHNENGLDELQHQFGPQRVDEMVAAWNRVRGLASILESFDALHRHLDTAAWDCARQALVFAAETACASLGDSYPNNKFVHEKSQRLSHLMPNMLTQLWDLESCGRNSTDLNAFLERCRAFCDTYLGVKVPAFSSDMLHEVPLKTEAKLVTRGSNHFIVWNKTEVFQVSEFTAAVWRNLEEGLHTLSMLNNAMSSQMSTPGGEASSPCRVVVDRLEKAGLIRLDWMAIAEPYV